MHPSTPICFSLEVYDGHDLLVSEGFNTNSYSMIIDALQEAIEELRKLKDPAEASA